MFSYIDYYLLWPYYCKEKRKKEIFMTSRIKAMRFAMDESDQELVGINVNDEMGLDVAQIRAIYNAINQNKAYKNEIDLQQLNYVTDNYGHEGILPADYNEYICTYEISPAYFIDYLPTLYKIVFNEEEKVCLIYFICTFDGYEKIFVNNNLVEVLKNKNPEEISNIVKNAQVNHRRKRNK